MSEYIHGGTDEREVARLEKQAVFASRFILPDFGARPGEKVLDLATGVGAMADQLRTRFPGILLFGLDLRWSQLRTAKRRHPVAFYVQGDGAHLPFADRSFDRVHCSWMLEHVPVPLDILREVRRVLKEGACCQFTEVDNATFRTVPEFPEVKEAMDALNQAQVKGGGDPFVGRRLGELFKEAGFRRAELKPGALLGSALDLVLYRSFVEEFAEIFESLDEALGPSMGKTLHAAASRLRELPDLPDSSMHYASVIGTAFR